MPKPLRVIFLFFFFPPAPLEFCRKETTGIQRAQVQAPPGSVSPCSPGTDTAPGEQVLVDQLSFRCATRARTGREGKGLDTTARGQAPGHGDGDQARHRPLPKAHPPQQVNKSFTPSPPWSCCVIQPLVRSHSTHRASWGQPETFLQQMPSVGPSRLSQRCPATSITAGPLKCKITATFFSILLSRKKKYLILCIQLSITLKHDVLVTRLWKQSRAFHLALQPLLRYRVTPESHLGEL